jgi:hypothetical protein
MDIDLENRLPVAVLVRRRDHELGQGPPGHDLRANLEGRHVVLVEGVVDTGHSVKFLLDLLAAQPRQPPGVHCSTRSLPPDPGARGLRRFKIGDEFVMATAWTPPRVPSAPYVGIAVPNAKPTESPE